MSHRLTTSQLSVMTRRPGRTINAMAETVDTKPVFREAFQRRRCIAPVDNFYEWKKLGPKEKQPYAIALAGRSLMALAGVVGDLAVAGKTRRSGHLSSSPQRRTSDARTSITACL